VEHGQEADGGTEQSGIGGGFKQRGCGSAEQDRVDLFRVLKRQPADLSRQREHDVEIGNREKLGLTLSDPLGASRGLALGAMPIPTRVIQDDAMSALIAQLDASAERSSPAVANVTQGFSLLARQD
jgi:hypothetical protein